MPTASFKKYNRTPRSAILEETFSKGMYSDNIPLPEGAYKHLVNFQIREDGRQLVPRHGYNILETSDVCGVAAAEGALLFEDTTLTVSDPIKTMRVHSTGPVAYVNYVYYDPNESYNWDGQSPINYKEKGLYRDIVPLLVTSVHDRNTPTAFDEIRTTADGSVIKMIHPDTTNYYIGEHNKLEGPYLKRLSTFNNMLPLAGHPKITHLKFVGQPYNKGEQGIKIHNTLDNFFVKETPLVTSINNQFLGLYSSVPSTEYPATIEACFGSFYRHIAYSPYEGVLTADTDIFNTQDLRNYGKALTYISEVSAKSLSPSYAVTYGYNMLSKTPYSFQNEIGTAFEVNGMLPYSNSDCTDIKLSYSINEGLWFRTYITTPDTGSATLTIKFRPADTEQWQTLKTSTVQDSSAIDTLRTYLVVPAHTFYINVELTDGGTVLSSALYSFDGGDNTGDASTKNVQMVDYDLTTCLGMLTWKQRVVLWGVKDAPDILFTSDVNNPTYFPYPNNIELYDAPILKVVPFLDALLVFTPNTIYKTELNLDGKGYTTTTVATDVQFAYGDMYSVITVKNMVFYKSGNYYYMLVPSTKVLTMGELKVAPISTPINYFLDHFDGELRKLLCEMYCTELEYANPSDITLTPDTYSTYQVEDDVCIAYSFYLEYPTTNINTRITYTLKYNTLLRVWRSELIETNTGDLQLYQKNTTGSAQYITMQVAQGAPRTWYTKEGIPTEYFTTYPYEAGLGNEYEWMVEDVPGCPGCKVYQVALPLTRAYTDADIGTNLQITLPRKSSIPGYFDLLFAATIQKAQTQDMYDGKLYIGELPGATFYTKEDAISGVFISYPGAQGHMIHSLMFQFITRKPGIMYPVYLGEIYNAGKKPFFKGYSANLFLVGTSVDSTEDTFNQTSTLQLGTKQYLDTGYRAFDSSTKKRFRELQLKINNKLGVPLEFSTGFILDSERRVNAGSYLLTPVDGTLTISSTAHDIQISASGEAVLQDEEQPLNENVWALDSSNLTVNDTATVRWRVSGKGYLPRMTLLSKNKKSYELHGINWVSRIMNMR